MPKYKTLRIPEDEYDKLKEIQRLIHQKGIENVDWKPLAEQTYIEVDDDERKGDEAGSLTAGVVIGLGAAALAYLLWKGLQEKK